LPSIPTRLALSGLARSAAVENTQTQTLFASPMWLTFEDRPV
jgi:hypothetical protein